MSLLGKLISPLNVQANKRKYEKPFKPISWSDSENSTLTFGLKQNFIW